MQSKCLTSPFYVQITANCFLSDGAYFYTLVFLNISSTAELEEIVSEKWPQSLSESKKKNIINFTKTGFTAGRLLYLFLVGPCGVSTPGNNYPPFYSSVEKK